MHNEKIHDWYMAYSNDVYQYLFFMTYDHELAKDLMQDTFIRGFEKHDTFLGTNPRSWLIAIARNQAIDYMKKKKPLTYLLEQATGMHASEAIPDQMIARAESESELYRALQKLKRSYREVIILRKLKELSIAKTAIILKTSEGKVKTTLWRAMKALRKQLEKEGFVYESIR